MRARNMTQAQVALLACRRGAVWPQASRLTCLCPWLLFTVCEMKGTEKVVPEAYSRATFLGGVS